MYRNEAFIKMPPVKIDAEMIGVAIVGKELVRR